MKPYPLRMTLVLASIAGSAGAGEEDAGLGTAHPGLVEVVAPDGRWAVICQAREDTDRDGKVDVLTGQHGDTVGDRLVPYLVVGGGPGTALTRFLATDHTYRYVVASVAGALTLFDTVGATRSSLDAVSGAGEAERARDEVSFDGQGRWLLTIRSAGPTGARPRFVVRSLPDGTETVVDPGTGLLVGGDLTSNGSWIVATVVVRDTDGDGELEAPIVLTSLYEGGCRGPVTSYGVYGHRGDDPVRRVLAVRGGLQQDVVGFLCFFGDRWLRRAPDGALSLEGAGTAPKVVATAAEKAYVLASNDAAGECLIAASSGPSAGAVVAVGQDGARVLDVTVKPPDEDEHRQRTGRVSSIGWYAADAYDWSKHAVVRAGGPVLASAGSKVLVVRSDATTVVLDLDSNAETVLSASVDEPDDVWQAGSFVATSSWVIDLAGARVVGRYPDPDGFPYPTSHPPLMGIRDDGRLLYPASPSASSHSLPSGPFRWRAPDTPK